MCHPAGKRQGADFSHVAVVGQAVSVLRWWAKFKARQSVGCCVSDSTGDTHSGTYLLLF